MHLLYFYLANLFTNNFEVESEWNKKKETTWPLGSASTDRRKRQVLGWIWKRLNRKREIGHNARRFLTNPMSLMRDNRNVMMMMMLMTTNTFINKGPKEQRVEFLFSIYLCLCVCVCEIQQWLVIILRKVDGMSDIIRFKVPFKKIVDPKILLPRKCFAGLEAWHFLSRFKIRI